MSNPFDVLSPFDRLASSVFDTARAPRLMPVDLDVDGQLLTIRAERRAPASEQVKWLAHERPYGNYMRQFTLGNGVDADKITANYEHGVLSVIIPMAERAKPRKIRIGASDARQEVTA